MRERKQPHRNDDACSADVRTSWKLAARRAGRTFAAEPLHRRRREQSSRSRAAPATSGTPSSSPLSLVHAARTPVPAAPGASDEGPAQRRARRAYRNDRVSARAAGVRAVFLLQAEQYSTQRFVTLFTRGPADAGLFLTFGRYGQRRRGCGRTRVDTGGRGRTRLYPCPRPRVSGPHAPQRNRRVPRRL